MSFYICVEKTNISDMRKLVSASLFTLILGGCSWIENVFRTDVEYIWNLDHEEVTVSSDIPGSVAV